MLRVLLLQFGPRVGRLLLTQDQVLNADLHIAFLCFVLKLLLKVSKQRTLGLTLERPPSTRLNNL